MMNRMKVITRAVLQWVASANRYVTIEEESYEYFGPIAECKKPKAPAAPDPRVVASAQTQQNRDTAGYNAALNRIDTFTPYGSQQYSSTGIDPATGAPMYRQDISLDPQLEGAYRTQLGQNERLNAAGGNLVSQIGAQAPFSLGGLPALPTDYSKLRDSQADALYGEHASYLDPQFKQGEDSLRSRLANQGITEGSEAYRNAVGDFDRSKEFAYGQARKQAISGAGLEADRAFGMQSTARNQMLAELLTQHQLPFQDLAAIRGMTNFDMPQFEGTAQVGTQPADITGAMNNQYAGQVDQHNAKVQERNAQMQAAASIAALAMLIPSGGASAAFLSDVRAKENIEPLGELPDGTGWYAFNYKGDPTPHEGVMAQEVERRNPAAVRTRRDGLKEVDYGRVLARALEVV